MTGLSSISRIRSRLGQSMIEYTIVVGFGVLTLTTGPMRDVLINLVNVIHNNYQGYSYAIAVSDYPDANDSGTLETMLTSRGVPDDQAHYLAQNPFDLFQLLKKYVSPNLPDFQAGLDEIADQAGLSPADFLEGLSPVPF